MIDIYGIPVMWVSNIKTEIYGINMEAEYIALSHSTSELLLLYLFIEELGDALVLEYWNQKINYRVGEDNFADLIITESPMPSITPSLEHIRVKYHLFYSCINGKSVCVKHIESNRKIDNFELSCCTLNNRS